MAGLLMRWILNAIALGVASAIVPGIEAAGVGPLFVAALVLGILNSLLRPILLLVTLPINLLTLGLFTFVINAFMLMLAGSLVKGFAVAGFGSALVGALVLSLVSMLLNLFVNDRGQFGYVHVEVRRYP